MPREGSNIKAALRVMNVEKRADECQLVLRLLEKPTRLYCIPGNFTNYAISRASQRFSKANLSFVGQKRILSETK